jgi:hypothetical protein
VRVPASPRVTPPPRGAPEGVPNPLDTLLPRLGNLADLGDLHLPALPRPPHRLAPPLLPTSSPALPATGIPSPGGGSNPFPGSLAVLVAVAAAASLVARRLRFATPVWPTLRYASLIERPG